MTSSNRNVDSKAIFKQSHTLVLRWDKKTKVQATSESLTQAASSYQGPPVTPLYPSVYVQHTAILWDNYTIRSQGA